MLTRPDGLLFAAAGAASPWFGAGERARATRLARALATTLAPVALVLAVLVPWKLAYYGELLPTAFYAKSATRPYVSQGLVYVGPLPREELVPARRRRPGARAPSRCAGGSFPPTTGGTTAFLLASAALFTAYLVHVGGDFMFARRILPVVPLVLLVLESRVVRIPTPRLRGAVAGGDARRRRAPGALLRATAA